MEKLFVLIFAVLFSFDVQAQNLESITGGISYTGNNNTQLSYDGRIPGLEAGLSFLLIQPENEYKFSLIAESNIRYWTEAVKSDHYTQIITCSNSCYPYEQAAISLSSEIGVRNKITIFRDFYISLLTGLNYEIRFYKDPDFDNPAVGSKPYQEFNVGLLAKAKVYSFLTNRTKLYLTWQSAYYGFLDNDSDGPVWLMPSFSAGVSFSLN